MFAEKARHKVAVQNVSVDEVVVGAVLDRGQVGEVPCVGQLVEIDDWRSTGLIEPLKYEVRADETSSTGH